MGMEAWGVQCTQILNELLLCARPLDTGETVTKAYKHLDFWGQRARGADDRQTCGEKDHFSGTWDPSVGCAPESTILKVQHRCGTS